MSGKQRGVVIGAGSGTGSAKLKINDAAACRKHVSRSGPAVTVFGSRPVVRGARPGEVTEK
ncbi:MAG: hypothetical protein H5U17_16020 [Defluviimonas sp.]|jgi:uncharacterized protein (DUF1330 family)|nr:hypothetical protein [Defluviimonas sp.]